MAYLARRRRLIESCDWVSSHQAGREEGEEPFELAFSPGVRADQLRSIAGLQAEVSPLLYAFSDDVERLINCVSRGPTSPPSLRAC